MQRRLSRYLSRLRIAPCTIPSLKSIIELCDLRVSFNHLHPINVLDSMPGALTHVHSVTVFGEFQELVEHNLCYRDMPALALVEGREVTIFPPTLNYRQRPMDPLDHLLGSGRDGYSASSDAKDTH
jgi:hypothetical protein